MVGSISYSGTNTLNAFSGLTKGRSGQKSQASEDSSSVADRLQSQMASQKKQAASEEIARLKQQLTDVALLSLVNPKGAARMYADMGKRLENAAEAYSNGNDTLQKIDAADTTAQQASAEPESAAATIPPEQTAQAVATAAQQAASERQSQLQAYAATAQSTADDKSIYTDIKGLSHGLEARFRQAIAMAEEQDQSEANKLDLKQMQDEFFLAQDHTRGALKDLSQQISHADHIAYTSIAQGPLSVSV